MNKEIKEKWLTALRSGNYEQGYLSLKDNNSYCCLGVLCDVISKDNNEYYWERDNFKGDTFLSFAYLPEEIQILSKLNSTAVEITLSDEDLVYLKNKYNLKLDLKNEVFLSQLNDESVSFEDIANLIQKYL